MSTFLVFGRESVAEVAMFLEGSGEFHEGMSSGGGEGGNEGKSNSGDGGLGSVASLTGDSFESGIDKSYKDRE